MPFVLGQVPFSANSSWNKPVGDTPTYTKVNWPASSGYNYSVGWDSYSSGIYIASATDPVVQVTCPGTWGWGANPSLRMPSDASGAVGTDGSVIIIDGDTVYNFWQFKRTVGALTAKASAWAKTSISTGTGWGTKSPFLAAGITAAGCSLLAGLLVEAETKQGVIKHALKIACDFPLVKAGPAGEAINSDGGSSSGIVQEGDRIAIPKSVAMPSGLSPLGQIVFKALQDYGAFVVDVAGGVTSFGAQDNAYDGNTMTALWHDAGKLIPLTQKVKVSSVTVPANTTPTPPPPPPPPPPVPAKVTSVSPTVYALVTQVAIKFDGPVTVSTSPASITLDNGATAQYISGTGTDTLIFEFKLAIDHLMFSKVVTVTGIKDANGNTPTI